MANGTVTGPKGFLAAGLACGIKKSGKPDLGLIVCPAGAKAAAVFTTNKITAAPVQVSEHHIKSTKIYAVVVNSGNANACTGKKGIDNAIKMCAETAKNIEVDPHQVLVASTGIIGEQLPIGKITKGISKAVERLSASQQAGADFAEAIMTTDTEPKQAARQVVLGSRATSHKPRITIAGAVKGAGMIAPNMATTLLFITTDAAITKPLLAKALKTAIDNSLNKLTIDGCQSTNDTAIILASGAADNRAITGQCSRYKKFTKVLCDLCDDLARQMALDAEGATRMFKVIVEGAATKADAAKAARAIADYPLVKCAVHGADANWGRIIVAAGSAGVKINPNKLSCQLDNIIVLKNGSPKNFDAKKANRVVSKKYHTIMVNLGAGKYTDFCYGCDLSTEYVKINADYHT